MSVIPKGSLPHHMEEEDREGTSFQTTWTNRIEREPASRPRGGGG